MALHPFFLIKDNFHADLASILASSGATLQLLLRNIFGAKFRIFTLAQRIESYITSPLS